MDSFGPFLDSFWTPFDDTNQFVCHSCDYITSKKSNFEKHKLTAKHLRSTQVAKKVAKMLQKSSKKFSCDVCDYNTSRKCNFDKHVLTSSHMSKSKSSDESITEVAQKVATSKMITEDTETDNENDAENGQKVAKVADLDTKVAKNQENDLNIFLSDDNGHNFDTEFVAKKVAELKCGYCDKQYISKSGLRKHMKICIKPTEINTNDLIDIINKDKAIKLFLMEQNKQLIEQLTEQNNKLFEQNSKLMQIMENNKVITTNTNTNILNTVTNNFNLNVFLNEKCKDALNITDFVESLVVKVTDLEETTRLGYANGVSKIFIDGLKKLDIYKRPLHCSDLKREVIYIKDSNQWIKENDSKSTLMNAIKCVAKKNVQNIFEWQKLNPDYNVLQSKQNDKYNKIICESMSGSSKEEQLSNYDKIIKNIVKEVVIDKLK